MRKVPLILVAAVGLSACDRMPSSSQTVDRQDQAAAAQGNAMAADAMAGAEKDADRARLAALERQVAELKAEVETSDTKILDARISALEVKAAAANSDTAATLKTRPDATDDTR